MVPAAPSGLIRTYISSSISRLVTSVPPVGDNTRDISRFFAPQSGINEDPVTGSAHTLLTPYWAQKLGKNKMTGFQCSKRGGQLKCQLNKDRVMIGGATARYMHGTICIA